MFTYLLFVIGFVFLIKGAGYLVDGASSVARRFNISDLVIGLTIVSFGTSAPELVVNITASYKGSTDLAIGNILGSNIANILLILGTSALIYPIAVERTTIRKEIPLSFFSILALGFMANDRFIFGNNDSVISRTDGLILIFFFFIFMYFTFSAARQGALGGIEVNKETKILSTFRAIAYILLGLFLLTVGGDWIVKGAIKIAATYGMSETLIGLTVVAIGTSLPELATSAVAAYKKESNIAIGNVVGSNIFNVFWILGVSSLIKPLPFQSTTNLDVGVAMFASFLLLFSLFIGQRQLLKRWQGFLFIAVYISYLVFSIIKDQPHK